jgi:saccharopine dehydrogenase (NAD+, L-lysine-forming)
MGISWFIFMSPTLGIRKEDKNRWERRVPIIPKHVKELKEKYNIETVVQPSEIRVFSDKEYNKANALVQSNLMPSSIVFAVKEIPINLFEPGKTYVFFSHTIKGQKHNMPMLKQMMKLGCTLIDYEKIADENGKRLVFFGKFAGLAGMVDTLWIFGQRANWEKINTPFNKIKQTINYKNLEDIKKKLKIVGKEIKENGLPSSITPFIVGFSGYGNVSIGAQEILDLLPVKTITPNEIQSVFKNPSNKTIYKVVFKEEHMVQPIKHTKKFNLQDYYNHPEDYKSIFEDYVPYLSIIMNCIFWSFEYPRLVTKKFINNYFKTYKNISLKVIGDISVDINGAIEFTEKTTSPDNPVFVYNPITDKINDGCTGEGIVVLAVDNLPCELPKESSEYFSETLLRFIPEIMKADFGVKSFENLNLPLEIKKAVILYNGKLTPNYAYINKYL